MADMLGRGEAAWAEKLKEAEAQLRSVGKPVTKNDVRRIAFQMMEAERPLEMREEAGRFGELVTSQQEPEGLGSIIYRAIKLAHEVPVVGRIFLPFARTLANLMSNSLDFTPWGMVRAVKGAHFIKPKERFAAWERRERAAASVIGTAAMGVVWAAAAQYADQDDETVPFMIYGFGPKDPQKRKMMPKGWKPFTIKIGNKYWSYAETPLVYALALPGSVLDAQRYGTSLSEKSLLQRTQYYGQAVLKASFSQGVLSSMGDLIGTMSGEVNVAKLAARFTSGAIPAHGLLRDITALFDPVKINDDTIAASILRDVPVLRHMAGKPDLDYMGDPITYEGLARIPVLKRIVADQRTNDREKTWVGQMRLTIPAFQNEIKLGTYLPPNESAAARAARIDAKILTDDERYEFVKRAGQLTREGVKAMRYGYEQKRQGGWGLPDREAMQSELKARVDASRTRAMRELMAK
jgi:hypothetical protein